MKVMIGPCNACWREGKLGHTPKWPQVPLRDDSIYEVRCIHGHVGVYILQSWKFDILFCSAINAVLDGYYRDAVATFSASLERFLEFYIYAICKKNSVGDSPYNSCWEPMKNLSERQYGAFLFTYLLENKSSPPNIEKEKVSESKRDFKSFRNNVIHNGYIPNEIQAISFGRSVFNFIVPILKSMRYTCVEKETKDFLGILKSEMVVKNNLLVSKSDKKYDFVSGIAFSGSSLLEQAVGDEYKIYSIEDCVLRIKEYRREY